jgi:hypothetical protein
MKKRLLLGIVLFLALNHLIDWGPFNMLVVFAQSTQVTGTITDPNGLPYAGAAIKAGLVFAGTPVSNPTVTISTLSQCRANGFGSAPCQVPFNPSNGPFALDSGGNIPGGGITLQDNSLVTPARNGSSPSRLLLARRRHWALARKPSARQSPSAAHRNPFPSPSVRFRSRWR